MVMSCNPHGAREDAATPFNSLYFPGSAAPLPRGLRSLGVLPSPFLWPRVGGGALLPVLKCAKQRHFRTASPLNHTVPWRDVQDCSWLDGNNCIKKHQPAPSSLVVHPGGMVPGMSPGYVLEACPVSLLVALPGADRGAAGVAARGARRQGFWLAGAAFRGLPAACPLCCTEMG